MREIANIRTVLMAEDDPDDRLMAREAWTENQGAQDLRFVENGEELLDYVFHRGDYADTENAPRPSLIVLDLNMPKIDGREALKTIKSDPTVRQIPVIVLSTSGASEDITQSYDLGVNCFITKALTFDGVVKTMKAVEDFWFSTAALPLQS